MLRDDLEFYDHRGLVIPELITADQYSDRTRAERVDNASVRLMLAVMEDAVGIYKRRAGEAVGAPGRRDFDEVDAWMRSQDHENPFSFERICEVLGFESDAIRASLERWKRAVRENRASVPRRRFRRVSTRAKRIGSQAQA